jgi:hypothetical protein
LVRRERLLLLRAAATPSTGQRGFAGSVDGGNPVADKAWVYLDRFRGFAPGFAGLHHPYGNPA